MPKERVPTTERGVGQKVSQENAKGNKKPFSRKSGNPEDKTFVNFQVKKGLFWDFEKVCKENSVNQSEYLRTCMQILIDTQGNLKGSIQKIEKLLAEMKFKKGSSLSKL